MKLATPCTLSLIHIFCVISVKLQEAEFEGQTKAKLGNTEIRTLVSNMVYTKLMEFFEENPGVAKAIFEKATQAARARAAAKKARELVPVSYTHLILAKLFS